MISGGRGERAAGDYHEEAEREDAGYADFVFELHLQSGDHDDGEEDYDDVCCDVD